MKTPVLLFSTFLLFSVHTKAQCFIDIPVNVVPIYGWPEVAITDSDGVHWICSGQTVTISGNNNLVYLEYAATLHVTGNDNTIISKGGVAYYMPGNGNLLYTTLPASVVIPGNENNVVLCESVVFDYPWTPPPDCIIFTTAVPERSDAYFRVYPNPVVDRLYIVSDAGQLVGSVRVLDMQGRAVVDHGLSGSQAIDMKGLPAGLYSLLLSTPEGLLVRKVIKE